MARKLNIDKESKYMGCKKKLAMSSVALVLIVIIGLLFKVLQADARRVSEKEEDRRQLEAFIYGK